MRDEAVRRPWYFSGLSCFITMLNKELQFEIFFFEVRHPRCVGSITKESLYTI